MTLIRSERFAAVILLLAAITGLALANSPWAEAVLGLQETHFVIPGLPLDLSVGHWISDGLLVFFFFVAAIELKHELVAGELNSFAKAIRPAIAALGGVLVPSVVYLAFTVGTGFEQGWPIPTATDIAFALGVLAVFGKGMPARLRIFMLALAILDDIFAIVIIALFFTDQPNLLLLAGAVVAVVAFGFLSRKLGGRYSIVIGVVMAVLAIAAWVMVAESGVHATIAGVALGLAMARRPAARTRHALEPFTNGLVLPLFALSASMVVIPQIPLSEMAPPFWGILVALPVGKIIGIALGGWLGSFIGPKDAKPDITLMGLITAGALGGIGFTVSLLMNDLAFAGSIVRAEGTLAVLLGSGISIVLSAILVSRQAAYYRMLRAAGRPKTD